MGGESNPLLNQKCPVLRLPGEGGGTNAGAGAASEAWQGDARVIRWGEAPPFMDLQCSGGPLGKTWLPRG